jgi:hypothetical protein
VAKQGTTPSSQETSALDKPPRFTFNQAALAVGLLVLDKSGKPIWRLELFNQVRQGTTLFFQEASGQDS